MQKKYQVFEVRNIHIFLDFCFALKHWVKHSDDHYFFEVVKLQYQSEFICSKLNVH